MASTRAKAVRPRRQQRDLREDLVRGLAPLPAGAARVDRDKGLIRGIKLLGKNSLNGRRYTDEAIAEALDGRLYEGLAVYVDHPPKPDDPRPVRSKFGRILNVRLVEGELYGDLEYLKSHPDAELICEVAERMPEQLGASHNARGDVEKDAQGLDVVRHILEVRSIDVVTEPASTGGFFEHKGRKTVAVIKVRQLFENSWKKYSKRVSKRPRLAGALRRLIEQDEEDIMDQPVPGAEEVPADHEEALADGFKAAIDAVWEKYRAGDAEAAEIVKQIAKLIKAHDKLTNGADRAEEDLPEEEEEAPADKEEAQEQLRRIRKLERENLVHREASRLGLMPDEVLMEALMDASSERHVKKMLEREKERQSKNGNPPRSGAGGEPPPRKTDGEGTMEGFAAALFR